MTDANRRYDRRTVLRAGVTGGAVLLAGCASGDDAATDDETTATDAQATTAPPPSTAGDQQTPAQPTETPTDPPPTVGNTPGPTPTVTADIESFYDDFEVRRLDQWTDVSSGVSVVDERGPDGGAKALRVDTGRQAEATAEWAQSEPGWDQPWVVDGLFKPVSVPSLPDNPGGTPQFGRPIPAAFGVGGVNDAGSKVPRFDMQVYRPESGDPAVRLEDRDSGITEVVDAPPLATDRWYRYEIRSDGAGQYTARRWPENGSRRDGVTVTASGPRPARFGRLRLHHDSRVSGLGRLALDHAFLRYRRNSY